MEKHASVALLLVAAAAVARCAGTPENPCDRLAGIVTACGDTYEAWTLEACRTSVADNCTAHDVRIIHRFYDCLDDAGLTECDVEADTAAWNVFGDCYRDEQQRLSEPCTHTGVAIAEF